MIAAVLAPGQQKSIDINDLHYALGHAHEGILRTTAKDMGTKVTGTLRFCGGCANAKGLKASVPKSTRQRGHWSGSSRTSQDRRLRPLGAQGTAS